MNEGRLNLGVVQELSAESFGEPGSRSFRIRATTASGEVGIWIEKEQVVALGAAIGQILERVPTPGGVRPHMVRSHAQISGEVRARAGLLALAFDRAQNAFVLEATDLSEATLAVEGLILLADREQLGRIEGQVEEIVAGSRPRCSMCGRPLTQAAHFCPPSNGHARVRRVEESGGEAS